MAEPVSSKRIVRFGVFEVDRAAGELRKQGLKVKLQEKPFQVLTLLLERPGEVVTREELQRRLWPDTFVDFEHSLSTAIKKLRDALGDTADNPRFIETRPGRGYRFIAPVEGRPAPPISPSLPAPAGGKPVWRLAAAGFAVVALLAVLVRLNVGGWQERLLGGAAPGQITSLAVLPLENLSGDPEQEYFADGMTDAVISDLGKIEALRVISRTSVMQYKQVRKPLPEIARELNVDAVIEGSVQRVGDRVRISVQLIQAVPESHLWAKSFERDLSDILALESELARAIANEIEAKFTPEEEARLASTRPVNPEAHEAYLKGRNYLQTQTNARLELAREYFQQAIEKDPNYALAYAALAQAYQICGWRGLLPRNAAITRAKAAAEKALEMDPALGEAHASLARIRYWHDWDWSGAERAFKRAIELNPSNANAYGLYSHYLTFVVGRPEESIAMHKRLVELDPLSPAMKAGLGIRYIYARRPSHVFVHFHIYSSTFHFAQAVSGPAQHCLYQSWPQDAH